MSTSKEEKKDVTILFAGDSGDGIQLTGSQFTNTAALFGNDISTFPNFPAEIRAPQGTEAGVSGFQLHFGSVELFTPGDECDVLVVMNAAGLKVNLNQLKKGGIIICNTAGFDKKNLRLAKYDDGFNPLEGDYLKAFKVYEIDVTKLTREALKESGLGTKIIDRSKNMFILGFIYWMFNRDLKHTENFIETKFAKKPELVESNIKVLRTGYNYGETTETFSNQYEVSPAKLPSGEYRNIMGNQATALGFIAAAKSTGLELFYGTYPITPASDVLHELAKHKNFGVKTFQAEDEIAAVCASIGASFAGGLGITASSGPGIALKGEAIGLAVSMELPLVVLNVQRGGPSTGLPTKTEQSDLLQALYGRNGESPIPVISANGPKDSFDAAFTACKIALEHMTPVMLLTDGYMANGSEPWMVKSSSELPKINVSFAKENQEDFKPFSRDENLVRPWAIPGTKGLQHRIGGLEKAHETGNVSYDPENHEFMTKMREDKVAKIAETIPDILVEGSADADVLVLGWGSTYGVIKTAVRQLEAEGKKAAHVHLRYINPMPKNLGPILKSFKHILMPEMNRGQLIKVIREKFLVDAKGLNKVKGIPFTSVEIRNAIQQLEQSALTEVE
jgi:2-oxoglutarate ferredoxin oxidoreductase subunit alpha